MVDAIHLEEKSAPSHGEPTRPLNDQKTDLTNRYAGGPTRQVSIVVDTANLAFSELALPIAGIDPSFDH